MKKILLAIGLGISALATHARELPKEIQNATATPAESLLWKITKEGDSRASYLFGTIHMICKEDFFWTDAMQGALDECEKVCFELDITDKKIQMQIGMGLINRDGKKLKDYFNEEEYDALQKYVKENIPDIPKIALPMLKPVTIATTMVKEMLDCKETKAYETEIADRIKADKKPILSMEEVQEQIDLFLQIPNETVVKYINERVQNGVSEEDKANFAKMIKAYKAQQNNELVALTLDNKDNFMDTQSLLTDRNIKWIPRMIAFMGESSVFFAVGAAHLGGEQGVIELLRKEGYNVAPIK